MTHTNQQTTNEAQNDRLDRMLGVRRASQCLPEIRARIQAIIDEFDWTEADDPEHEPSVDVIVSAHGAPEAMVAAAATMPGNGRATVKGERDEYDRASPADSDSVFESPGQVRVHAYSRHRPLPEGDS